MTRNGKIARLPQAVREQLNQRLADGVPGTRLVEWLNALPEVKQVLAAEFAGEPIHQTNLSRWKKGGYQDWALQQETRELARGLAAEGQELFSDVKAPLSDRVGVWFVARYAVLARKLDRDGDAMDWKRLRELCRDIVALRRGDHGAKRLKLFKQRLEFDAQNARETPEQLFEQWSQDPEVRQKLPPGLSLEEQEKRMRAILGIPPREPGETKANLGVYNGDALGQNGFGANEVLE